jgi:hypothetical protein
MSPTSEDQGRIFEALSGIGRAAHQRCGQHPGFDCVLCFVRYRELVRLFPDYHGTLFATAEEHQALSADFLKQGVNRQRLISVLLDMSATQEGPDGLAARVRTRVRDSLPTNPVRPQFYAAPTEEGVAVALAIYDKFWTDEW